MIAKRCRRSETRFHTLARKQRQKSQGIFQRRLGIVSHQRDYDENAEQSVDNARDAANKSMKNSSASDNRAGANSARKIAAPIPSGTAIASETVAVMIVP